MKSADAPVARRIIELALTAAKTQTIKGTYERIAPGADGRIRTVLSPVGTETGRFSSSDSFLEPSTNLQNLAKKVALADPLYDVRRCIIAREGCVLIEADLSQAEARAVAAYANDVETLAVFASGSDIHRWTASRIFGVEPSEVSASQRHLGKMARHALNYGMGWKLFMERINKDADLTGIAISASEAKRIVAEYHAANAPLLAWWDEVWAEAISQGYLTNAYGRRRDFLSPYYKRPDVIAFKPQSSIADHLNEGMVRLARAHPEIPLVLQVHDSVLAEVPEEDAMSAAMKMKTCLDVPLQIGTHALSVPVDVAIGPKWNELKEVPAVELLAA